MLRGEVEGEATTLLVVSDDDLSLALTDGVVDEIFSLNTSDRLGRDFQLHDGVYFCPSYSESGLRFSVISLFS